VRDRRGPATVTEQTPAARLRAATGRKGREGAERELGSQETSLRSETSIALVERGQGMNKSIAALLAACILTVLAAPTAEAAPAEVDVRIEGKAETLFEGPVLTDGHNVKAITDTEAPPWGRRCDGLNNGANPTPGPTATAAAVDAMAIVGEGFDGDWYGAESFDDYFITQWGPERQDVGAGDYWGVVVNNVFTSVGGCQFQVDNGDEVLWVYDAFDGRPQLVLYPGDYSGGSVQLTAKAALGAPFEVSVEQWGSDCCASDPQHGALRGRRGGAGGAHGAGLRTDRHDQRRDGRDRGRRDRDDHLRHAGVAPDQGDGDERWQGKRGPLQPARRLRPGTARHRLRTAACG
jgi:hypothetical protein